MQEIASNCLRLGVPLSIIDNNGYGRQTSLEVYKNTKQKCYPNGQAKITFCSRAIFKDSKMLPVERFIEPPPIMKREKQEFVEEKPDKLINNTNLEMRSDSSKRAKEKVFDITMLNKFDYFITWTLDKEKIDRYDEKEISKKLKYFLNNASKRFGLKYIVIPEYHKKDKAIHMHGLISGNMNFVDSDTRLIPNFKKPISKKKMEQLNLSDTSDGVKIVYNMPQWEYGYSTAIRIYGETENTAKYMTKYITKDLKKIFGNYYYAGGKVQRNPEIKLYNTNYTAVNEKEYYIPQAMCGFKYLKTDY